MRIFSQSLRNRYNNTYKRSDNEEAVPHTHLANFCFLLVANFKSEDYLQHLNRDCRRSYGSWHSMKGQLML